MSSNNRPSKIDAYFGTQNRAIVSVVVITVLIVLAVIFSRQILDLIFQAFIIVLSGTLLLACLGFGKFGKRRK